MALLAITVTSTLASAVSVGDTATARPVYRLYNPSTTEHLYTTDGNEVRVLSTSRGWTFEGTSFYEPLSGTQVERLFNPSWGIHHYTEDAYEIGVITTQQGWQLDSSSTWFTSGGIIDIHRLWNASLGQHLYTTDENEVRVLTTQQGWVEEHTTIKCLAVGVIGGSYSTTSATVTMRYQTVVDQAAYDEPVYGDVWVFVCSDGTVFTSAADADGHTAVHDGNYYGPVLRHIQTGIIHHDAVTHDAWVAVG